MTLNIKFKAITELVDDERHPRTASGLCRKIHAGKPTWTGRNKKFNTEKVSKDNRQPDRILNLNFK